MAALLHELWIDADDSEMFCLAGPMGDEARASLQSGVRLIWTIEAGSHFEAMTKYYEHMGWGAYKTEHDWDYKPYPDDWLVVQSKKV